MLVDVGTYPMGPGDLATVGNADSGDTVAPVVIQGTLSNGGSRLVWTGLGSPALITFVGSYISVSNLSFEGGGFTAEGTNLVFSHLAVSNGNISMVGELVSGREFSLRNGLLTLGGGELDFQRMLLRNSRIVLSGRNATLANSYAWGGSVSPLLGMAGTNLLVRNNTLINSGTVIELTGDDSHAEVRNNIIIADGLAQEAFCLLRKGGILSSDFNLYQVRRGAWIGNAGGSWERLLYWQSASGQDTNSIVADPLFAAESAGDLHVQSVGGRWTSGVYVVDAQHSPAIDLGDPSAPFAAEPAPNGSRVNIGLYGDSVEASLSRPGGWLYAMSLNDGPAIKGSDVTLRWTSGGLSSTNRVTLQFSANNGVSWTNIVQDVPVNSGVYTWNSIGNTSTLAALWRVVLQSDTGILDAVDQAFSVRNQPLIFYVNDSNTVGDVYTSAAGSSGFDGRTPATPKPSLLELLTNFDLEGGDTVYVDTGLYPLSQDVRIIWSDGGDPADPVRFIGSTNAVAGGSILDRGGAEASGQSGFDVLGSYVSLRDFTIRNAFRGLLINSNYAVTAEGFNLYSNTYGALISKSVSATVRQTRVWQNLIGGVDVAGSRTVVVEHITSADNGVFHYRTVSNTFTRLQNNIFYHSLFLTSRVSFVTGSVVDVDNTFMDYNIYYFDVASANGVIYGAFTNLTQWQRAKQRDYRSAQTNPLLVDVAGGDLHVQSTVGRYLDGFGFTFDAYDSWAIDHANPASDFGSEPAPNGGRANIGAYGGTGYASKGNTNAYFEVRVLNDALSPLGTNDTPFPLLWHAHLVGTGQTVRVEYSGDGGVSWQALATGLSAYQEYLVWNLSPLYNTLSNGLVRVVSEQQSSLADTNDGRVAMFFGEHMRFRQLAAGENSPVTIVWRGSWGEHYQVQYATAVVPGQLTLNWSNAPLGGASNQVPNFVSPYGGDQVYEDPVSSNLPHRLYRVIWDQNE